MQGLFCGSLFAPHPLVGVGESVPAMGYDARNVAVVVFDGGSNFLSGCEGGAEEHEGISWSGNVVRGLVARRTA